MAESGVAFTLGEIFTYYAARVPRLKQKGRQWRGACPVHQGKRFSFSVDPQSGCWYCFAECGRGGSLIDFEMATTGTDFKTALEAVHAIVGRPMPPRARMTREEWRTAKEGQEREEGERTRRQAEYFAGGRDSHARRRAGASSVRLIRTPNVDARSRSPPGRSSGDLSTL